MIEHVLPSYILKAITSRLDFNRVYEIRLRANRPTTVNYDGKYYYLRRDGIGHEPDNAITADAATVNDTVIRAADYSLYASYDSIAGGFITVAGGARIGIAGSAVTDGQKVKTFKNFGSLNIRIPHAVQGCAAGLTPYIRTESGICNTLIVAPPGCGKTTYLRDIAAYIADAGITNVLVADERAEIAATYNGVPQLYVGRNTDVLSGCSKAYAFDCGIRSLRPDVIITDELTPDDFQAAERAMLSGVRLIAAMHAESLADVKRKQGFERLECLFDCYAVLRGIGTLATVADRSMTPYAL